MIPAPQASVLYLGNAGNLLPIPVRPGSLTRTWTSPVAVVDDGLPRAQVAPQRPYRSWRVQIPPSGLSGMRDVAGLHELLVTTTPPWLLADPLAQVSNLLTPEASVVTSVAGLSRGGGWDTSDGQRVGSVALNPAASSSNEAPVVVGSAPVLPGRSVTAAAYLASLVPASVRLTWLTSSGGAISSVTSAAVTGMDRLRRAVVTAAAPGNAAAAQVVAVGAQVVARASLTWTTGPTQWAIGGLAQNVVIVGDVVDDVQRASSTATADEHRAIDLSFTLQEVR